MQTCHNTLLLTTCQSVIVLPCELSREKLFKIIIAPEIDIHFIPYHHTAKNGSSAPFPKCSNYILLRGIKRELFGKKNNIDTAYDETCDALFSPKIVHQVKFD